VKGETKEHHTARTSAVMESERSRFVSDEVYYYY